MIRHQSAPNSLERERKRWICNTNLICSIDFLFLTTVCIWSIGGNTYWFDGWTDRCKPVCNWHSISSLQAHDYIIVATTNKVINAKCTSMIRGGTTLKLIRSNSWSTWTHWTSKGNKNGLKVLVGKQIVIQFQLNIYYY